MFSSSAPVFEAPAPNPSSHNTDTQAIQALSLYTLAASYAAERHTDQRRKNAKESPYIEHPLRVAAMLIKCGVIDGPTLCAAVMHDVAEDTVKKAKGETVESVLAEIKSMFGEETATMVRQVTDDKTLSKIDRKKLQIVHVKDAHTLLGAKLIKLADKYDNLSDIQINPPKHWSEAEKTGYIWWSYAVVREIKHLNADFNKLFDELFAKFGIVNPSEDEVTDQLAAYYEFLAAQSAQSASAKTDAETNTKLSTKPPNPYTDFCRAHRDQVKIDNPDADMIQINAILAVMYRESAMKNETKL
jgi:guanosine-3',5'-bis(diphosphate) 3'-pyrophosphohydrolase